MLTLDNDVVHSIADEMRGLIRANFGRRASEESIREFFENGGLDQWIDSGAADEDEAEEALELAIDMYMGG